MSKTFKQAEWGTVCGVSMPISGCGPCSLACITYNLDEDINPKKTATWLHNKGVFSSDGTTRSGMTLGLQHYGFESFYYKPEHSGNSDWKNAINKMKNTKSDWWAILLVVGTKNGGRDNFWTSGGHFISITDYKDGKVYVRDSGQRNHTGYYSLDSLKYDTNCIWFIQKKTKDTKKTYSGTFPKIPANGCLKKGDTGDQIKYLQLFLMWYGVYTDKVDRSFGEKTEKAVKDYQRSEKLKVDGLFGSQSLSKAKSIKK